MYVSNILVNKFFKIRYHSYHFGVAQYQKKFCALEKLEFIKNRQMLKVIISFQKLQTEL